MASSIELQLQGGNGFAFPATVVLRRILSLAKVASSYGFRQGVWRNFHRGSPPSESTATLNTLDAVR